MGTPLATVAGIAVGANIMKPSIHRINRYIRINKHLTDIYTYNTIGSSGVCTNTAASEM